MEAKIERRTLTVTEAAEALGVSRNKAYDAARRGEIPTIKIGKRILVPVVALERMLQGSDGWMPSQSGVGTATNHCQKRSVDARKYSARIVAVKRTGKSPSGPEMT